MGRLRSGGRILVDTLIANGVETAFCVPGESFLEVLDALHDSPIRLVTCRHEGPATHMAEAGAKLTGRPGVALVTRAPGATHASVAVHTAFQDSTPLVLLIGQVARETSEREAFQEIDYRQMFGGFTKWVAQIDDAARIPELLGRAFQVAMAGRRGPVVLALPEDMLTDCVDSAAPAPRQPVLQHPGAAQVEATHELLRAAERPLLVLGGSGWTQVGTDAIRAYAERMQLPVACAFRRQDLYDNTHRCYIGDLGLGANPALVQRVREADLLLAIGTRLGDAASQGYTAIEIPQPRQTLVHVLAGPEELGRVYQPTLAVASDPALFCLALDRLPGQRPTDSPWLFNARVDYQRFHSPKPKHAQATLDLSAAVAELRRQLPPDAIVTNGAGNHTTWLHRHFSYRQPRTQLAPTSGTMGYAVPAAVAAALLRPGVPVVCWTGDGCFLMSVAELATVALYELPVVFIVVNNGMYGTIRMHQERHYPSRVTATALRNPDFVDCARSFGLSAARVECTADFGPVLAAALKANRPALIELVTDPDILSPAHSVASLRAAAANA
ncbi:MAG: thiamine pyrophosphate-binding protein [Pseudomonadota bacterium]|nr:thiamine pyrophosphate-binding protein [Pseudomonadota bacterium]